MRKVHESTAGAHEVRARTAPRGWYADRTGARYVSVPLGKGRRKSVRLGGTTDAEADARTLIVREIAITLHEAGQHDDAVEWATKAAEGDDERAKKILGFARALANGREKKAAAPKGEIMTFKDIGGKWTSGELAKTYPDQIVTKRTVDMDVSRLGWLYEDGGLGDVPIIATDWLDRAERAMGKLDPKLRSSTRRQYAQAIRRVLEIAVYPMRLIASNPLPRGFLPKPRNDRAKQMVYPDEEAALMVSAVPLAYRVAYGFLARMGFRKSEAVGSDPDDDEPAPPMTWDRLDLERGVVYVARSKADKPRPIALSPDVVRALKAWRRLRPKHLRVFSDNADEPLVLGAGLFREHLLLAGVKRAELHATEAKDSIAVRVHDLRALFVTISIAQGKPEHWIRDRTSHKTLSMVDTYRRHARMFEELNLGGLVPLDEAIPELRKPVGAVSDAGPNGTDRHASDIPIAVETATNVDDADPEGSLLIPLTVVRIHPSEQILT